MIENWKINVKVDPQVAWHTPFGRKVFCPCVACGNLAYCVGMWCACIDHVDGIYNQKTDGFEFWCAHHGEIGAFSLNMEQWTKNLIEWEEVTNGKNESFCR